MGAAARSVVSFMRERFLPEQGVEAVSDAGTRLAVLRRAALTAILVAALLPTGLSSLPVAAAMPLRESAGLAVTCRIDGLPGGDAATATSTLCARVIELARRAAPYPVSADLPPDAVAPRLSLRAAVEGATPETRTIRITAELTRPGQPAARRLAARVQPVAYRDQAAVDAAIDSALAAVLPWRHPRRPTVPTPPRAH